MSDKPGHYCGVAGMALTTDAVPFLRKSLRVIQHRGQESAGIAIFDGRVRSVKGMGLVHEVLTPRALSNIHGTSGIGHVRYSTTGSSCAENVAPIVVTTMQGEVALAHNGDIVNAEKVRQKLQAEGWAFLTTTDSEIIVRIMANELSQNPDPVRAIKNTMKIIDGAYALTLMFNNRVFGVRDPLGFRPLCVGRLQDGYCLASESAVFDVLQGEFLRDVLPGEIMEITSTGVLSHSVPAMPSKAHCMFEWVYFARPDSVIDGVEVYLARKRLGHILAEEQPADADVVIPVPDSGRAHAMGYSEVSGIPYDEGLMKNRYVERTFIMPEQIARDEGVMLKLNPIKSTMKGKRVVIVDDSIVRGTTMRRIVQMARRAGAKEVHVRIGCPPIKAPCYYGIDMKTREQFAASNRSVEEIARLITADSLGFTSIGGLVKALGMQECDLCMACLTGEYPTHVTGEMMRFQKKLDV